MVETIDGIDPWKLNAELLAALDRAHARLEELGENSDLFNEIGCLIAKAKGEG